MYRQANYLLYVLLMAITSSLLLVSACTNDLKKIQEISAKQVNSPADTTRGVDMIFSDSAKVKARVISPLMLEYQASKEIKQAYTKMPKGIHIIFFDADKSEMGNIIADTAYYYPATKVFLLLKNVVVTSAKKDVFKSDELKWDQVTHKITSSKPIDVKMANGNIVHGTSLETNEKFDPYTIPNQTGIIYIDRKLGQ
jgi:LPS export ABC transporter protein LptC